MASPRPPPVLQQHALLHPELLEYITLHQELKGIKEYERLLKVHTDLLFTYRNVQKQYLI
jgi:hypothetical protein